MLDILIWNVRGLNDPRKKAAVKEHILANKVSICCLQETKESFSQNDIRDISGGGMLSEFVCKPSIGASGGILICWNDSIWRMISSVEVYGPCEDSSRHVLWEELSQVKAVHGLPWCVLGDFNVTRFVEDRNRIAEEGLVDLPIANQNFTWSNLREVPALARLDRVLIDAEWEEAFPLCRLSGLPRICSDHSPLLLVGGDVARKPVWFRFENWWLLRLDFKHWWRVRGLRQQGF
ncbi:hypothetical protein QJS10_CPB18g00678 [Acorus calamus]|uniref:Endonuclease/exonuclease/phosphatase domain-containing protein n=1 Tax=Acorus calamus TaxID=4465 RepID=A0AAV9CJP7_ACOCL|nr:hypothetical protein QJS10_CPB18g00678 [Acorus calamus]